MVFKGLRSQAADIVHTVGQLLLRKPRKDKDVTSGFVGAGADSRGHEKVGCQEDWCGLWRANQQSH